MGLVSIVVPAYNAEETLNKCLDSLICQTHKDIEIIVVNDGSTDKTYDICNEYQFKDDRVKVIHTENHGVSSARNTGIDHASGEYLMFCDSDDYVSKFWCEKLHEAISKETDAMISCNFVTVNMKGEAFDTGKRPYIKNGLSEVTYYELYLSGLSPFGWNKIYSTKIINMHKIRFEEEVSLSEDVYFNLLYLEHCSRCLILGEELYFYLQREGSLEHRYHPDLMEQRLGVFYKRIRYIKDEEISAYCDNWLYRFILILDNVFDERNKLSYLNKLKYNKRMVSTKEFQFCVHNATGKNENQHTLKLLRNKNYYGYWFIQKIYKLKSKILK